ncbi:MAG: hypothetical protein ACJAYG_002153 [Oceanicoccus sp.]
MTPNLGARFIPQQPSNLKLIAVFSRYFQQFTQLGVADNLAIDDGLGLQWLFLAMTI